MGRTPGVEGVTNPDQMWAVRDSVIEGSLVFSGKGPASGWGTEVVSYESGRDRTPSVSESENRKA